MKSHPKEVMSGPPGFDFGLKKRDSKLPLVKQRISLSLNAMFDIEILDGEHGPLGEDKTPHSY